MFSQRPLVQDRTQTTDTRAIVPLFGQLFLAVLAAWTVMGYRVEGQFSSRVNLVEVYASVTDREGRSVANLTIDDFEVREDEGRQKIQAFAAGNFPLAVAVGLDRSFSVTRDRLSTVKTAVRSFVGALRPDDQATVLAVGSQTEIAAPLTSDHTQAMAALEELDVWGTTPLYDAILTALDVIKSARGRRALVLLSDGVDRYSRVTATEVVEAARQSGVLVYPIAIGSSRPPLFVELAVATGGRSFVAKQPRELEPTLATIARDLRLQYLLGYVPNRAASSEPRWHAIEVRVRRPDLRVRARDGYWSR